MTLTIYHNPRCSKSRATLELIREHGIEPEIIDYLKTPPDARTLRALIKALDMPAVQLARRGEAAWKSHHLSAASDDDAVIAAMLADPNLIERPIVVRGQRAVLGRPPENVTALLDT